MANLKELLEFLKSQTASGRDQQELDEALQMRQAEIAAADKYAQSPARVDREHSPEKKALAAALEMYHAPQRAAESKERAEIESADKQYYQDEEARKTERFKQLMKSLSKK